MTDEIFDRETLLDLTVNIIPLGILLFFIGAFVLFPTWGVDPLISGLQFTIVGGTAILLVILTYYAGKAVSKAENEMEAAAEAEHGAK